MKYIIKKIIIKDGNEIDKDTSNFLTNKFKNKIFNVEELINFVFDFIVNEIQTFYEESIKLNEIKLKKYNENVFHDIYNETDEIWVIYLTYEDKITSLIIFLEKI
ncbi:MAG: hypothetical protein QW038_02020 [Nanopusillaceae archaeon]